MTLPRMKQPAALAALALAGCIREHAEGKATLYTYEHWTFVLPISTSSRLYRAPVSHRRHKRRHDRIVNQPQRPVMPLPMKENGRSPIP